MNGDNFGAKVDPTLNKVFTTDIMLSKNPALVPD